ncbi:MAG: hypothetical protein ACFFCZ_28250 [Promethearchaeota archaeon]
MITKEQTVFLLRIGIGIVFIQNGLLLSLYVIGAFGLVPRIMSLALCIDIIGFLTIALALLLFSQYEILKKKIYYRFSGLFIVGWVIVTIFWRVLLLIESKDVFYVVVMPMSLFLSLSAILLAIGTICLYYVRRDGFTRMFSIYGILNVIGTFVMPIMLQIASDMYIPSDFIFPGPEIIYFMIGISIKGVLVPLVAVSLGQFVIQKRIYGGWIDQD